MSHAFVDEEEVNHAVEGLSTGCIAADYVCGVHGFPRGRITEVYGYEQSGKSTLVQTACAKAQSQGLYPVYLDLERALDPVFSQNLGFDIIEAAKGEKGLYLIPKTFEETLLTVEKMVEAKADLVVVDSVAAMVPESTLKGDITDMGAIGLQARMFSAALPRINSLLRDSQTAVVLVNQLRSDVQTGWLPPGTTREKDKTSGGKALKYYASVRLELEQTKKKAKVVEKPSRTNADRPDQVVVASRHSVFAYKNKVAQPYLKQEFYIRYDPDADAWGIDNLQTIIDMALAQSRIETKGGGYFLYKGIEESVNVRGEESLYAWLMGRPKEIQHLRQEMGV